MTPSTKRAQKGAQRGTSAGGNKRKSTDVRAEILRAGLKVFAERGYAGASVQDIIDATKVTKPVLYYYFESKAGLYKALLGEAYDESYRMVQDAAARCTGAAAQLVEIFTAYFEFLRDRRDLLRLAFAAAFASPGELPPEVRDHAREHRNFELVHELIRQAQSRGELTESVSSLELANGIYGALCFHLMIAAVRPEVELNRASAGRIVDLFLNGAERRPL